MDSGEGTGMDCFGLACTRFGASPGASSRRSSVPVALARSSSLGEPNEGSELTAPLDGTTQECRHCHAYIDVGDLAWDDDFGELDD